MKNKIIFTQDLPGERNWLQSQFPKYANLETVHAGHWPNSCPDLIEDKSYLLEVPESDDISLYSYTKLDSFVSLFDLGHNQTKWIYADKLLSNVEFSKFSDINKTHYQGITFGRVGTVFVESLFNKTLAMLSSHTAVKDELTNKSTIDSILPYENSYVVLTYRSNWWAWASSMAISHHHGFYHFNDDVNWDSAEPIIINEETLKSLEQQIIASWNFFFQVRMACPRHSFYLLKFEDMLKNYANNTDHKAMSYDKKKLIQNYDQAEEMCIRDFLPRWETWGQNAVRHLASMECRTDIDNLF